MSYKVEVRDSNTKHIVLDIAKEFDIIHKKIMMNIVLEFLNEIRFSIIWCVFFPDSFNTGQKFILIRS